MYNPEKPAPTMTTSTSTSTCGDLDVSIEQKLSVCASSSANGERSVSDDPVGVAHGVGRRAQVEQVDVECALTGESHEPLQCVHATRILRTELIGALFDDRGRRAP